jgi:YesN/AraC family two-component response regulator
VAERKTTVLLADDEPMILRLLHRILDAHEHLEIICEARDGHEALELARTLEPDAIVLDHSMPGMTGLDVAEILMANTPAPHIILFSAMTHQSLTDEAHRLGIAVLPKTDVASIADLLTPDGA